uniref:Uncharacterized protein n=2 Tax=Aegilops tauschii subsp. strangulata TaxID=200361 RepID=A0A453IY21_AEGTS
PCYWIPSFSATRSPSPLPVSISSVASSSNHTSILYSCIEYNSKIYMICLMDDLWLAYLPEHTRFDMMPFFLLIRHPSLEHLIFLIAI